MSRQGPDPGPESGAGSATYYPLPDPALFFKYINLLLKQWEESFFILYNFVFIYLQLSREPGKEKTKCV